jgi:hypothetical protein
VLTLRKLCGTYCCCNSDLCPSTSYGIDDFSIHVCWESFVLKGQGCRYRRVPRSGQEKIIRPREHAAAKNCAFEASSGRYAVRQLQYLTLGSVRKLHPNESECLQHMQFAGKHEAESKLVGARRNRNHNMLVVQFTYTLHNSAPTPRSPRRDILQNKQWSLACGKGNIRGYGKSRVCWRTPTEDAKPFSRD